MDRLPLRHPGAPAHGRGSDRAKWRSRRRAGRHWRSEEHTSELQSLMRISYAVFGLKKKRHTPPHQTLTIARIQNLNAGIKHAPLITRLDADGEPSYAHIFRVVLVVAQQ